MPNHLDFDELEALEREVGPTLRSELRGRPMRPGFANSLREELQALPSRHVRANGRRRLWLVPGRAWAGLAAVVAVGLVSSIVLLATRPQPASAAEVLSQVQAEAVTMLSTTGGPECSDAPATGTGEAGVAFAVAHGPDGGSPGSNPSGPVKVSGGGASGPESVQGSATDLSDKLAQALGVSGDRVRNAMIATMRADMPSTLPPDPFAGIAQQLGLSREQVCKAFMDSQTGGVVVQFQGGAPGAQLETKRGVRAGEQADTSELNLNTATPAQLTAQAQRLGVTPDRLATAVHAAVASMPTPPPPPSEDQIISRFAQNLGLSEDKVRAAIKQVEGNNGFYFAVPVPGLAKH